MRKTKIVCTIGPTSRSQPVIEKMIQAGMNVARLNFSHGDHAEHLETIRMIRAASERVGQPVAILQDLSGPKIRIGAFADGQVLLEDGAEFIITNRDVPGDAHEVGVNHPSLPRDVHQGDLLMLADGTLELKVLSSTDTDIRCEVQLGGVLGSNKGINLPSRSVNVPSLTDKDVADLAFGLENDVDYVALSFVRTGDDVRVVKQMIQEAGSDAPLIAKIEKHEAVRNIDSIIEAADGLMVARGDLGIEIPLHEVPMVQKMVIMKANAAAKPVITATQMLRSMVDHPRPTRAEVTDVANAVLDGADAVMLSEETAIGNYVVETIATMSRIADDAELAFPHEHWFDRYDMSSSDSTPEAICHAACHLADTLETPVVIAYTQSGSTARLVSKFRPHGVILGVTPIPAAYRRMALIAGVIPILIAAMRKADESVARAKELAMASGYATKGDRIIIIGGVPIGVAGTTNSLTTEMID